MGRTLLVYGAFFQASPVMYVVYITFQAGRPSRVGPYAGPGRGVFYELRVARSDVVSLSLSRRNAASESAKKAVVRGSWFVKAHHHSGRAPHVGALTKHGISCPIVGACTWQARYGYVNIMHADICVCFHALRVHHRFRQVGPYAPGRWPYFFCEPHSFPSPVCDTVGDAQRASRCESWVGPFWYMGLFFKHHPSCMSCISHFRRAALAGSAPTQAPVGAFFTS